MRGRRVVEEDQEFRTEGVLPRIDHHHLMPRTKLGKSLPQSASRDAGSQQDALGACPSCDVNCVRTSGIGPVVAFLCGR